MIRNIREFIEQESLLEPTSKVVVGLSGGMDSMALIHLLTRLGYDCVAAHCNFHLRGEESQRDTEFVVGWCKENEIPLKTIDFDTHGYAAEHKISIEMAARELRYEWFERIRLASSADAIAVAHHRDDSVETVMLNLIRGTGIRGLTGISPRNRHVIRPLLCVYRNEIEAYIEEYGIPYREDSTNREDIYTRNAIRLKLIPNMQLINPKVKEAILRTSNHLVDVERIYHFYIKQAVEQVYKDHRINIELLKETVSPQAVLYEILSPLGFSPSTIQDVYGGLAGEPGRLFFSNSHRAIKDRGFILVEPIAYNDEERHPFWIEEGVTQVDHPVRLTITMNSAPIDIRKEKEVLYVDADKIRFPLLLRRWEEGDWFIPFGMKGKKKLSDFFTDRKLNIKEKEEAWLLVSGEDIVWVVGERGDNRFRVTPNTRQVIVFEIAAD